MTKNTCPNNKEIQKARSQELQKLLKADQEERDDKKPWSSMTKIEILAISEHDLTRRKRVSKIFAGCFTTAEDYAAASLIFQHGDVPEHYFIAFRWAERAVELGGLKNKALVALTIDRYLINIHHKQLFGSQAFSFNEGASSCYCLEPTERSFPDSQRKNFTGLTLEAEFEWLSQLNKGKNCPNKECSHSLKPSPKGTIIGFW